MARRGRESNLRNSEGRQLRLKTRFNSGTEGFIDLEFGVYDVVRNFEKTIRNEVMYDTAEAVVNRAKQILRDSKGDSLAFSDVNQRSKHLEERITFTPTETDSYIIVIPDDIEYANITDLPEAFIEPVNAPALRFYWFRHQFTRIESKGVVRPGNMYLTNAIKQEASIGKMKQRIAKQIHYWSNKGINLTERGGNLGSRKSRASARRDRVRS
jgi:hypothetical protein